MLRPANATWFELLTPREQLELALRCLAATHRVELQAHGEESAAHLVPQLRAAVDEYHGLAQRYQPYWPTAVARPVGERALETIPKQALERLLAWVAGADALTARLQQLALERSHLELVEELLRTAAWLPDLSLFSHPGALLASRVYLLVPASAATAVHGVLQIPPAVVAEPIDSGERRYLLALGPPDEIAALDESLSAQKARRLELPQDLPAGRDEALAQVRRREDAIAAESHDLRGQIDAQSRQHRLAGALGDLAFAHWLLAQVPELAVTPHFGWITGWTSDLSGGAVEAALRRAHVQHVLRFPQAPAGLTRPVILRNPRWAQPFELFERLLGIPAASEADPSVLLAVLAPLMFGFMFGDAGQGAVLVLAGWLLRRRYPLLALLIPGGFAAMVFGALFGSVFAREDLLPALWLHPLEHPLVPLTVSLAFGAGVLLLGLTLDAVQHHWMGQARLWWRTRAGLVLAYLGVLASVIHLHALALVPAGFLWFWTGSSLEAPTGRLGRFLASTGESAEMLLQLLVNTLSFVRIGAFALAHAGLASAIKALAAGLTSPALALAVLVVGNAAVIVIEGLIVGIQTTRLVLFEFFIRFLRGSGRPFKPLPPPALSPVPAAASAQLAPRPVE